MPPTVSNVVNWLPSRSLTLNSSGLSVDARASPPLSPMILPGSALLGPTNAQSRSYRARHDAPHRHEDVSERSVPRWWRPRTRSLTLSQYRGLPDPPSSGPVEAAPADALRAHLVVVGAIAQRKETAKANPTITHMRNTNHRVPKWPEGLAGDSFTLWADE
jgi:hypothetical protein